MGALILCQSMLTISLKVYPPPDIVDDAGLYVLEAICMSQNFNHSSGAEAMTSYGHFVDVEPVLPLLPFNTIETS